MTADDPFYTGFKGGYSSADESTIAGVTLATGHDAWSGMVVYNRRDGSELENRGTVGGTGPNREKPDLQDLTSDNILAKIGFQPSENHEFTLTYDYLQGDTDTQVLSDYGTVVFGTTVNTRDAVDEREHQRLSLAYDYSGDIVIADELHEQVRQIRQ